MCPIESSLSSPEEDEEDFDLVLVENDLLYDDCLLFFVVLVAAE